MKFIASGLAGGGSTSGIFKFSIDLKNRFPIFQKTKKEDYKDTKGYFVLESTGARFSKLPVITGPVKLFCFPFQMGVSKGSKIVQ